MFFVIVSCIYVAVHVFFIIAMMVFSLTDITQVKVTAKDCIHVRVYQGLDKKTTLNYVLYGKTLEDPIEIQ